MSFSSDTKIALAREVPEKHCCLRAMLAGMLFFSASLARPKLFCNS